MFARRNNQRRLDKQSTETTERSRLCNHADCRGILCCARRVIPRIAQPSSHICPRGGGFCAERRERQQFRQCIGGRNRTFPEMSKTRAPRSDLSKPEKH